MADNAVQTDVTRVEIADLLAGLFATGGGDRESFLAATADARLQVREVLNQLPDRRYTSLRQVWEDLPFVPVEL